MFRFGIPFIIGCLLKCTLVLNTDSNTTCLDLYIKTKGESMKTKSCTGEFIVPHCIPNEEHQEVDVCVQWKWITPGYCPYYDSTSNAIKEVQCSHFCLRRDDLKDICICSSKYAEHDSCKTTCGNDFKSYDYVFCEQEVLSTVTRFVPTTLSTTQKSVTYDMEKSTEVNEERNTYFGSALGIAFGVLIPIILAAAAILLIKYGKILENCKKGSKENIADIEAHPDEAEGLLRNKEEEKKKDEENERNEDETSTKTSEIVDSHSSSRILNSEEALTQMSESQWNECSDTESTPVKGSSEITAQADDVMQGKRKISIEIGESKQSSPTQGTVEKAKNESTRIRIKSNETGNKDKDVKLHAMDNREESLIPEQVISTSNQTPKSDINQEDSRNLQDDNKMSDCSTGGSGKEQGDSSELKPDEKDSKKVTTAEDTGGSVNSIQNNHENKNMVEPSNNLTEANVDQDGNLDACKPHPNSFVETDDEEEISSSEEEDTGGVFDDTLDSIKRKDDEEEGGSQDLHEFLEEVSTRLAKKMLYLVLKFHVTDPFSYLYDESKIALVKELLPGEYQASVSIDSDDKKSISVIYALLQLSLEEKPKSGWGQAVKDRDTGVGDDVERLYRVHTLYREIANPGQVSLDGYTRLFKVLFKAVERLDRKGNCQEDYKEFVKKWENLQGNSWYKGNLKTLQSVFKKWSPGSSFF